MSWFENNKSGFMKLLGFALIVVPAAGAIYIIVGNSELAEVSMPLYGLFFPFLMTALTLYGYHIARKEEMLEVERLVDKKVQEALARKDSIAPLPNDILMKEAAAEESVRH